MLSRAFSIGDKYDRMRAVRPPEGFQRKYIALQRRRSSAGPKPCAAATDENGWVPDIVAETAEFEPDGRVAAMLGSDDRYQIPSSPAFARSRCHARAGNSMRCPLNVNATCRQKPR